MAHFEYSSIIPAPKEKVFDFYSDFKNIPSLMPEDYKITPESPLLKIKKGSEIEARCSKFGISVLWKIIIEEVDPPSMFRERQVFGPFSLWVHTRRFEDHSQGTLLIDSIEYDLAFGILGKLAQDLYVSKELKRVFEFRHKEIAKQVK
ncbi:MAG: SRPBCC family protein [Oligoflexia bacterium]|nr:SRPBCC family protein [Oligoflexia bacterium]